MWFSLLTSGKTWLIVALALASGAAYFKGHQSGYSAGHREALAVTAAFDKFRLDVTEQAMIEQVKRNAAEAQMRTNNQKVTDDYTQTQTNAAYAKRSWAAERLQLLSAVAASHGDTAPRDTTTGLPTDATTEDRVVGECTREYQQVAGDAADLANQVTALQAYVRTVVPEAP